MRKERELLARVLGSRTFMQGVALRREIEELLAQPEPFKPDWVNYRQGVEDSKREPLSGEQRYVMYTASRATSIDAYMTGCRDTEKAHGIG